ncbi:MAG: universal stress protein [Bryobacteraceae bacterium]
MKILIALDFSPASETALHEAAARPWPAGSSIEILHVAESSEASQADAIKALLQNAAVRCSSRGLQAIQSVAHGDAKDEILNRARRSRADFILVGSHNKSGLARMFLGSVSGSVVRNAPCSVVVARTAASPDTPRRILLATDGFDPATHAARSIAARPWPTGTEVRVLSAVELPMTGFQAAFEPGIGDAQTVETLRVEGMRHAQNAVRDAELILTAAGLKTSESVSVLVETPKQIIMDEAEKWVADLIVVGAHGRSGIDRILLGSVSEAVAKGAICSVEVIRQPVA